MTPMTTTQLTIGVAVGSALLFIDLVLVVCTLVGMHYNKKAILYYKAAQLFYQRASQANSAETISVLQDMGDVALEHGHRASHRAKPRYWFAAKKGTHA